MIYHQTDSCDLIDSPAGECCFPPLHIHIVHGPVCHQKITGSVNIDPVCFHVRACNGRFGISRRIHSIGPDRKIGDLAGIGNQARFAFQLHVGNGASGFQHEFLLHAIYGSIDRLSADGCAVRKFTQNGIFHFPFSIDRPCEKRCAQF